MLRKHKGDREVNLGGVEELNRSLRREKEEVTAPESGEKEATDDLRRHRTAGSLDHPRGSIELKHLSRQVRSTVQRATESMPDYDTNIVANAAAAAQAIVDAAAAQATADGKIVTFYQDDPPTAEGTGDLWVDTNDGNKLYRWSGAAWQEVQDDDIAQAIADAATAQTTADSKIVTFYQDGIPTSTDIGDLWVDTNDKNRLYRAACVGADQIIAGEWEVARDTDIAQAIADAATAQATADGKVVTFYQNDPPTAEGTGDLWIDTNDGNKLYRWSGAAWTEVQDDDIAQAIADAATAQNTADGKIVTFYQNGIPTSTDVGDLWVDTNDGNKLYRAACIGADQIVAGEWEVARDTHTGRGRIIVAASGYQGNDELYNCDATADQVQIQAAINILDTNYGGGTVELTEGTFVLSAPIYLKSNIILQCRGWKTIIKKNGNFHGIFINGSSGSEIENVQLRDFKIIKDNADTNAKDLIHADYAVNLIMENIWCYKPKSRGAHLTYCENPIIQNCLFSDSISSDGLRIAASPTNPVMAKVTNCMSRNNNGHGFNLYNIQYSVISNNTARDNTYTGFNLYNLDYCTVVGNVSKDNGQRGIYLEPSTSLRTLVSSNLCEGNTHGITIGAASNWIIVIGNIAIGNLSNQFLDYGTDTHLSGNSWQQPVSGEPSCGTLHWLPEADRNAGWDLDDVTVSTAWEECDLSAKVPNGTKAIIGLIVVYGHDIHAIICVRDAGSGDDETNTSKTRFGSSYEHDTGNSLNEGIGIIKATNGKFDYRDFSTANEVGEFMFRLWGYWI